MNEKDLPQRSDDQGDDQPPPEEQELSLTPESESSQSTEEPIDDTHPADQLEAIQTENLNTPVEPFENTTVTQESSHPKPKKTRSRIEKASIIFSAIILLTFVSMTGYAAYRSNQLRKEVPPCNLSLSGTCTQLELLLRKNAEFTLPVRDQQLTQMVVSGGTGKWQGSLSLDMNDGKSLEVEQIVIQPSLSTDTLQVAAKASTRFDLTLPGETKVNIASPSDRAVRQLQISPFKSAHWTAKFPNSEKQKGPGMVIFPSELEIFYQSNANENLLNPSQKKIELYPGKAWLKGDSIVAEFKPDDANAIPHQIDLIWETAKVAFQKNKRLQMSPTEFTLKDIRLSEFSIDGQTQMDRLGESQTRTRLATN